MQELPRQGPRWSLGRRAFRSWLLWLPLALPGLRDAVGDDRAALDREVMPLLKSRCVMCHGPAASKGGLDLATTGGIARGGVGGPAVVPGRPLESPLWEAVAGDRMPPRKALDESEKAVLRAWIEAGAPGIRRPAPASTKGVDHWAFAPSTRVEPPEVRGVHRMRNAVDRFLQASLEVRGLTLGPEAGRPTLIRRVALDLTGLPPTPGEVARFQDDTAPDAYERMFEAYLASPRYAERWGKFWLDAAGYADSNGYFDSDTDRPLAYRYRDYVIKCWGEDRPIDELVRENLAGDELAGYRPGGPVDAAMAEGLVATQFLRNAPDGTGESDGNPEELRADRYAVLEGTAQVIGSSLLGLTVQCARCHDHKLEPISQRDYYGLYAILAPAYDVAGWVEPGARVVAGPADPATLTDWESRSRRVDAEVADLAAGAAFGDPFGPLDEESRMALEGAIARAESTRSARPGMISCIAEGPGPPPEVFVLKRGQYGDPGSPVDPAPLSALTDPDEAFEIRPSPGGTSGRRLAFARWLTRPGSRPSALLARVMANRIWQGHFGLGLVATPENLGYSGAAPSHPELLEFLATYLARGGWSAKALHRLILSSAAYRQSGASDAAGSRVDPANRLLWRYPLHRLDAETIRDSMLAVAGELDERAGGPYVPTSRGEDGEVVVAEGVDGARRRSVFLQQRRTQVLSLLSIFDGPSIVASCTRRETSTVPLQSLGLLNSDFVVARARGFAGRIGREAGGDPVRRVERAFLLAIGRTPSGPELAAARRFLDEQPGHYGGGPDAADRAWVDFCQMLLCSNAFLHGG